MIQFKNLEDFALQSIRHVKKERCHRWRRLCWDLGSVHQIEKIVPSNYRIVLIDEQAFMYAKIGAARLQRRGFVRWCLDPYDRLFKSDDFGVFVNATVTDIKANSVVLSSDIPSSDLRSPL
jgi:hypothetical protein